MRLFKLRGFTLIELLIVVAIIAILAAIAVPNFLEAQMRSKVTRCKTDMRSMATALEAYRIEFNHYPIDSDGLIYKYSVPPTLWQDKGYSELNVLTSPVAYITSVPRNVFPNLSAGGNQFKYPYIGEDMRKNAMDKHLGEPFFEPGAAMWGLYSMGPDMRDSQGQCLVFGLAWLLTQPGYPEWKVAPGALYDATNGTVSNGDIARVGP